MTTDLHKVKGKWFFKVNEGQDFGPYDSFTEADHGLKLYLAAMSAEEVPKEAGRVED